MRVKPPPPRRAAQRRKPPLWPLLALLVASALVLWAAAWRQTSGEDQPAQALEAQPLTAQSTLAAEQPTIAPIIESVPVVDPDAFTCTAVRVHDGDGPIWCAEGPKVRLSGIAAREIDETCTDGHPCPSASGASARDALTALALGKVLSCRQVGTSYSRVVAECDTPDDEDLSCAMIRSGTALRWDKYDPEGRLLRCEL